MKAAGLRPGMRVKTTRTILYNHPDRTPLTIPNGTLLTVDRVVDCMAFAAYAGQTVQVDPKDLDRVG